MKNLQRNPVSRWALARGHRPKRTHSASNSGFTLLELVVVMAIMILLIGVGALSFDALDEDDLDKPVTRLTQMSKHAHAAAVVRSQGMVIAFDKGGFGLIGDSSELGGYVSLPEDVKMDVLPWGARSWQSPEDIIWRFGPQGVSEPMSVRFHFEDRVRILKFHPLTGAASENTDP